MFRLVLFWIYWFQSLFSWNLLLMMKLDSLDTARIKGFNPCFRGTCSWWEVLRRWVLFRQSVSILVFVELALDGLATEATLADLLGFNPCFRGTCSWCWSWTIPSLSGSSFNPCFRGTCSWWWMAPLRRKSREDEVSILVFVELALDVSSDEWQREWQHVSILVFVELALDADPRAALGQFSRVSILVFVELALDDATAASWNVSIKLFQSLFSWNLLLMCTRHFGPSRYRICFNPCFRGTCSWWASARWPRSHSPVSFNPCFRGTCSWCVGVHDLIRHQPVFQSLFSWNLLLMTSDLTDFLRLGLGVSILVFVELALDVINRIQSGQYRYVSILVFVELALDVWFSFFHVCITPGFNPCFRGTCSWCLKSNKNSLTATCFNPCFRGTCSWCLTEYWTRPCFSVSILVFVELALDDQIFSMCSTHECNVSILVFVELALDAVISLVISNEDPSFNPCFRGTCSWWAVHGLQAESPHIVSILVFVELALDDSYGIGLFGLFTRFQSLFSWNLLLMICSRFWGIWHICVSILVFVELALDEPGSAGKAWSSMGFNPCFRGTCSWWAAFFRSFSRLTPLNHPFLALRWHEWNLSDAL